MAATFFTAAILLFACFISCEAARNPCEFYKQNGQIIAKNEEFVVNMDLPVGQDALLFYASNSAEVDLSDAGGETDPKIVYYFDLKYSEKNETHLNIELQVRFEFKSLFTENPNENIRGTLQCLTKLGEMVSRDIVIRSSKSAVEVPERLEFTPSTVTYNVPEDFPLETDITSGRTSLHLMYNGTQGTKIAFSIVEKVPFQLQFEQEAPRPARSNTRQYQLRIYLTQSLDYDESTQYTFHIQAKSLSASAELPVTINVQDVDTKKPYFEHKKYSVNITKFTIGQPPPVTLKPGPAKVKAVDGDKGINTKIIYKLINCSEFATYFDVDFDTGDVYLTNPRKAYLHPKGAPTHLVVRAEQADNPKRRARTRVVVGLPH